MTSGVYIMTNKVNGCRYVGYSKDIEWRLNENKRQLREGTFGINYPQLTKDYQTFGEESFSYGILQVTANDQALMNEQSEYWKDLINPEYNRQPGEE